MREDPIPRSRSGPIKPISGSDREGGHETSSPDVNARLGLSVNDTAGRLDDARAALSQRATFLARVSLRKIQDGRLVDRSTVPRREYATAATAIAAWPARPWIARDWPHDLFSRSHQHDYTAIGTPATAVYDVAPEQGLNGDRAA